jgi:hypothetical protein
MFKEPRNRFQGNRFRLCAWRNGTTILFDVPARQARAELEFLKSLWGLGTEEEEGYRTGPPELEFLKSLWGLGTEEE